jgi:hypothetical protein
VILVTRAPLIAAELVLWMAGGTRMWQATRVLYTIHSSECEYEREGWREREREREREKKELL